MRRKKDFADIFFNYSKDYGQTWLNNDVRLNLGSAAGEKYCWPPQVHVSGDNVYVSWVETRDGYLEGLFLNHSSDGGASWDTTDTEMSFYGNPQVELRNGTVSVTNVQDNSIFFRKYTLQTGWRDPVDVRAYNMLTFHAPSFALLDSLVFFAWYDTSCLDQSVRYNYSLDGGTHFAEPKGGYLNDNACGDSTARVEDPKIAISGNKVYVAWGDFRNWKTDIYFTMGIVPEQKPKGILPPLFLLLE